MSESCCRVVVLLGYTRPSLAGIGVPWVLTGTHLCALMPRVAKKNKAPTLLWLVLSCSHVSERRVRALLSDVGTENTYTIFLFTENIKGLHKHRAHTPSLSTHRLSLSSLLFSRPLFARLFIGLHVPFHYSSFPCLSFLPSASCSGNSLHA